MLDWNFEFKFRIKGSYYYSANLLYAENLIQTNQLLTLKLEPDNRFDINAVQCWLTETELAKTLPAGKEFPIPKTSFQNASCGLNPLFIQKVPTELSTNLSINLPSDSSRNLVGFSNVTWHYQPRQWLVGYLPRTLAKALAPMFKNLISEACNTDFCETFIHKIASPATSSKLSSEISPQLYATLRCKTSFLKGLTLALTLLLSSHSDFQWHASLKEFKKTRGLH